MNERKIICIRCPRGCEITTTLDGYGAITEITGNSCRLGIEYAEGEIKDPRRTLCTSIKVKGGVLPLCPVWTEKPVPKNMILKLAGALRNMELTAPVKINSVVLENALGTGVNIITSRNIESRASKPGIPGRD